MTTTPAVRISGLRKTFGAVEAVAGIELEIADGEFFSMLGPSGSGKTTVLRMIAGFERPTSGSIELAGEDVTGRAPYDRDVNTVFQDYAIFPHMDVLANVEYGLRVKKVERKERRRAGHVDAVKQHRSGGRQLEAGDHPQHRRLARPGRPEHREELPVADLQVDAVDRPHVAELLAKAAKGNRRTVPHRRLLAAATARPFGPGGRQR